MEEKEIQELQKLIAEKRPITNKKLTSVLDFHRNHNPKNNIACRYILIKNTADSIRERDFLHLIHQHIVMFVLDFSEYSNLKGLSNNELISRMTDIIRNAKTKFQTKSEKTGEVGELILFLLLEANGITQILSKMRLKTSAEMPVFGSDAVHVQAKDDELVFHFGEAKMYENFNGAIDSAINSIESLDGKQEDLEFDIITKNIDRSKFEKFTDKILDYLNPYSENKENMKRSHPIFIGYNWEILEDLTRRGNSSLSDYLKLEYDKSLNDYSNRITQKISSSKAIDKNFEFFVIPFKNVTDFRKMFLEML